MVLDTARYKYPPFWVDLEWLYKALGSIDQDTNLMRGFIVVSRNQTKAELKNKLGEVIKYVIPIDMPKHGQMEDLSLD